MGWFLKQQGPVNGFTNHLWNGITTLEWAKLADEILSGKFKPHAAIHQSGSAEGVTKHELLKLIAEVWPHHIAINAMEAKDTLNRTLVAVENRRGLKEQLEELRRWYR
jgi:dTDP-4-dehydrorhamnose reductase